MQKYNLSFLEKRELLEKYRSDLRKVDFERDYLISLINRLELELQIPSITTERVASVRQTVATTRPSVQRTATKVTMPMSSDNTQRFYGFKLSHWDILMLDTLKETNEPLNSGKLLEIFEAKNATFDNPLDDKQLRNALSRTVHKLANKKDAVLKVEFPGKGFLYSLNPDFEN